MNFPDFPSNGDTVTLNSKEYSYSSTNSTWSPVAPSGGDSASIVVSDTAPVSPSAGDMWFDSTNSSLLVYYNDGSSSQWVGVSGETGAPGATGPAGSATPAGNSTTFVADTAALIALTAMSSGDQALVVDTNKLFMYTGSAWYLIATMVNASPTPISGVDASYTLEKDGTATTITAVSTDPEGFPLTWSYAVTTGSLGSTATVSQADNVFTVTPSTDSADEGEFSITFSATDGGNTGVVNAISAFTLAFAILDPNFNKTSFLSHFEGTDNGVNNVFTDSSVYPHTITASGTVTQGSFSPFARPEGEWGWDFNGASDYVSVVPATSDFVFGTDDFTFECFFFMRDTDAQGYDYVMAFGNTTVGAGSISLYIQNGLIKVYNGGSIFDAGSTTVTLNTWHHVAIVRISSTLKIYLDGNELHSVSNSSNIAATGGLNIANWRSINDGSYFNGVISNVRVVKGTGVYTGNFTPSTSKLTAITNTTLLTCQSNRFVDNSATGHTVTAYATTAVSAFGPFLPSAAYDPTVNGASLYNGIDLNSNYVGAAYSTDWDLGSDDYTAEAWVYASVDTLGSSTAMGFNKIVGQWEGSNLHVGNSWVLETVGGDLEAYAVIGNTAVLIAQGAWLKTNQWNHVALVRNGNDHNIYINGVAGATNTISSSYRTGNGPLEVGGCSDLAGGAWPGYITDVRFVKGTAVYTSNFTPPTAPLTAIANTKLMLNMSGAQAIDSSAQNAISMYGTAKLNTTYKKFGTSSLQTVHGALEYAYIPTGVNLPGDFTIEGQFYPTTLSPASGLFDLRDANGSRLDFWSTSSGYYGYDVDYIGSATSVTLLNQWSHVAICRVGSTVSVYHNGVLQWTTTHTNAYPAGNIKIGYGGSTGMTGYIDEVRVSNFARYTGNFTAPVLEFGGQGI